MKFIKKLKSKYLFFLIPFLLVAFFLIVFPLFLLFLNSFLKVVNLNFVFLSFDNYIYLFKVRNYLFIFLNSLFIGLSTAFITTIIALPIAYSLFKIKKRLGKVNFYWIFFMLPIWINILVKTIALEVFFTFVSEELLIGTYLGLIIAAVYLFLPFPILIIFNYLEKLNFNLLEASADLGVSSLYTFWHVVMRFLLSALINALIFVFINATTTLVITSYIGKNKIPLVASLIEEYLKKGQNFTLAATMTIILLIVIFLFISLFNLSKRLFLKREHLHKNEKKILI